MNNMEMLEGVNYSSASLAQPDNPWWTNDMVERARLLTQNETDRMERRRLEIQRDIQNRLRLYEENLNTRQAEIERWSDRIRDWQDQPILGPTGTRWSRFKEKVKNYWEYNQTEIFLYFSCTLLMTFMTWAVYLTITHPKK